MALVCVGDMICGVVMIGCGRRQGVGDGVLEGSCMMEWSLSTTYGGSMCSGGLENLAGGTGEHDLTIMAEKVTLADVVEYVVTHVIQVKHRVFSSGRELRPGVLAIVNGVESGVLNGPDTELADGDEVSFISTLHGG